MVAAAAAVFSLILPPIGVISAAVVALVTLRLGAIEGLIAAALAGLGSLVFALIVVGSPMPTIRFVLELWLPVWVLSFVLRQTRSLDLTIHAATLFGLVILLGIHLLVAEPELYWQQMLEPLRQSLVEGMVVDDATSTEIVAQVSRWMTGVFAASFYLQMLLALFIGRWWQALLYNPGGFGAEFRAFRVSTGVGYLGLGLLILLLLLDGALWVSELLILLVPLLFLQGVALAHALNHSFAAGRGWLIVFYALLLLAAPHAEALVVIIGFLDIWIDLRARLARRSVTRGNGDKD